MRNPKGFKNLWDFFLAIPAYFHFQLSSSRYGTLHIFANFFNSFFNSIKLLIRYFGKITVAPIFVLIKKLSLLHFRNRQLIRRFIPLYFIRKLFEKMSQLLFKIQPARTIRMFLRNNFIVLGSNIL